MSLILDDLKDALIFRYFYVSRDVINGSTNHSFWEVYLSVPPTVPICSITFLLSHPYNIIGLAIWSIVSGFAWHNGMCGTAKNHLLLVGGMIVVLFFRFIFYGYLN